MIMSGVSNVIFDLAIAVFLLMAAKTARRSIFDGAMVPECDADGMVNQTSLSCSDSGQQHILRHVGAIAPTSSPSLPAQDDELTLEIGSLVELYMSDSYFATPAILTDKSSTHYNVLNVMTNDRVAQVDPQFIHPYKAYEDGTRASCNIGALRKTSMVPCVVESHSTRKSGVVLYQVSYLNEEGTLVHEDNLPFSRVQRVHGRRSGAAVA
jgi:hypothetical protein